MTYDTLDACGFIQLLQSFRASGGTAPGGVLDGLLAEHPVGEAISLASLVDTGRVFGFEWRNNLWIPMFQFDARDLSTVSAPQTVRAGLPAGLSGWAVAMWFAMPNARLDGSRPVDLLASDASAVVQAAQGLSSADESALLRMPQARDVAIPA
ncbi:hypothetical protein VLK31_19325 [Variovorax sp. H27-G14]|uniref:hypothetical protein n=1 Tax=Variovorax sp. H27-G14 TaxID=3111914 RepID=UPI0038FC6FD1